MSFRLLPFPSDLRDVLSRFSPSIELKSQLVFSLTPGDFLAGGIFTINEDGTGFRNITQGFGGEERGGTIFNDLHPSWSSDGTKIIFSRNGNIVLMNRNGFGDAFFVTNDPELDEYPSMLPNGDSIVFVSSRGGHGTVSNEIYSINVDGGRAQRLTNTEDDGGLIGYSYPVITPDGESLYFVKSRGTSSDIFAMSLSNRSIRQITDDGISKGFLEISPDGSKIIFSKFFDISSEIIIMSTDGTDQRTVISGSWNFSPSWSPDGTKFAFTSTRGPSGRISRDIFIADSNNGSIVNRLTMEKVVDSLRWNRKSFHVMIFSHRE